MPIPSPDDYQPLDANALETFAHVRALNTMHVAFMALMLYDHAITFDAEVERIWSLKWGIAKCTFLNIRYIVPPMLMLFLYANAGYPLLISFCEFAQYYIYWPYVFAMLSAHVILVVRVSALYGRQKVICIALVALLLSQAIFACYETILIMKTLELTFSYEFLPGCWSNSSNNSSFPIWLAFLCFEALILFFTLWKLFGYRQTLRYTIRIIARDSLVYFALVFASCLYNVIIDVINNSPPEIPVHIISCIAVTRMVLNTRGIAFDDGGHTSHEPATTIQFNHLEDSQSYQLSSMRTAVD